MREVSSFAYGRNRESVEDEIWDRQRLAKTRLLPDLTEHPNPPGVSGGASVGAL